MSTVLLREDEIRSLSRMTSVGAISQASITKVIGMKRGASPHLQRTLDLPLSHSEVEDLLASPICLGSEQILRRRFPKVAPAARIEDLPFNIRVKNWLRVLQESLGVGVLSQLSRFTINELLHMKNFGRKSLVNLLSSILPVIVDYATMSQEASSSYGEPPSSRLVTASAEHLSIQPYAALVRCNDPRFRSEAGALLYLANASSDEPPLGASASLNAVARRLAGRIREITPREGVLDGIRKMRYRIARARRLPLEAELEEISRGFIAGRNVYVALSFLGWNGLGVKTLRDVADEFHISPERVRQITGKFIERVSEHQLFAPTLRRTLATITRHLPASVEEIEAELCQWNLTRSRFRLAGIVSAAELLGLPVSFVIGNQQSISSRPESNVCETRNRSSNP